MAEGGLQALKIPAPPLLPAQPDPALKAQQPTQPKQQATQPTQQR